jgi:gamma-glutamyltranspeptidase/glutathione hydrolase
VGHPNCIQPGKRPRITLTPTIVLKDGKPVLGISVAGGDLQDQTTLNILLNHLEFDMMPAEAVTAPRFSTAHHQDSFDPNPDRKEAFLQGCSLTLNADVGQASREELARRGHRLETSERSIAAPSMLYIDQETGTLYAAGDPGARRHAAAI